MGRDLRPHIRSHAYGGKWNLIKKLIDDKQSKGFQQLALEKVMHNLRTSGTTDEDIFGTLASIYLSVGQSSDQDYPEYQGEENEVLDGPIADQEVWAALQALNSRSGPGPDGVTIRMLRNLDAKSVQTLTEEANKV